MAWVVLSLCLGLVYFEYWVLFVSIPGIADTPLNLFTNIKYAEVIVYLWTLGFIPIGILITLFPQSLLISEYQIMKAKNLYKIYRKEIEANSTALLNPIAQMKA